MSGASELRERSVCACVPPQWHRVRVPARATAVAQWARGMCVRPIGGGVAVGASVRSRMCAGPVRKCVPATLVDPVDLAAFSTPPVVAVPVSATAPATPVDLADLATPSTLPTVAAPVSAEPATVPPAQPLPPFALDDPLCLPLCYDFHRCHGDGWWNLDHVLHDFEEACASLLAAGAAPAAQLAAPAPAASAPPPHMAVPADAVPAIPIATPAPAAPASLPPSHSHVSRAALTSGLPRGPCCLERAQPTQERATPHLYTQDTCECPTTPPRVGQPSRVATTPRSGRRARQRARAAAMPAASAAATALEDSLSGTISVDRHVCRGSGRE